MTSYVVLRQVQSPEAGTIASYSVVVGQVDAYGDLDAIRRAARDRPDAFAEGGDFVAIPTRSFKVRKLQLRTVQRELWT